MAYEQLAQELAGMTQFGSGAAQVADLQRQADTSRTANAQAFANGFSQAIAPYQQTAAHIASAVPLARANEQAAREYDADAETSFLLKKLTALTSAIKAAGASNKRLGIPDISGAVQGYDAFAAEIDKAIQSGDQDAIAAIQEKRAREIPSKTMLVRQIQVLDGELAKLNAARPTSSGTDTKLDQAAWTTLLNNKTQALVDKESLAARIPFMEKDTKGMSTIRQRFISTLGMAKRSPEALQRIEDYNYSVLDSAKNLSDPNTLASNINRFVNENYGGDPRLMKGDVASGKAKAAFSDWLARDIMRRAAVGSQILPALADPGAQGSTLVDHTKAVLNAVIGSKQMDDIWSSAVGAIGVPSSAAKAAAGGPSSVTDFYTKEAERRRVAETPGGVNLPILGPTRLPFAGTAPATAEINQAATTGSWKGLSLSDPAQRQQIPPAIRVQIANTALANIGAGTGDQATRNQWIDQWGSILQEAQGR